MNSKLVNRKSNVTYLSLRGLLVGLLLIGPALIGLVGCGEPHPDGMPALYPASVIIMQDGKPLPDATVTLVPTDSALTRWPVGSVTDATGKAKLKTYAKYDGAPAGSFKVTVNKSETSGDTKPVHPGAKATPQQLSQYDRAMKTGSFQVTRVVAPKFRLPTTTTLSIDVSANEPNEFPLDVGAAVSEKDTASSSKPGAAAEYRPMGEQ